MGAARRFFGGGDKGNEDVELVEDNDTDSDDNELFVLNEKNERVKSKEKKKEGTSVVVLPIFQMNTFCIDIHLVSFYHK